MNQPLNTDPEERSFRASLNEGLKELRGARGPCPGSEELVDFIENRLDHVSASRVRDHVEACGLCDLALGRLARGARGQMQGRPAAFWGAVWEHSKNPVVAYALVVLLIYPAYVGMRLGFRPKATDPTIPVAISAPTVSLDSERTAGLDTGRAVVHLLDQDRWFILEFFVPMNPGTRYFVDVADRSGRIIVQHRELRGNGSPGKVSLVCLREAFRPGDYILNVVDKDSTVQFKYFFRVTWV